mmetsp:Transcript_2098/g.3705  ORF Transcript_2098/g.3705 Transcript_2098/m.3705 type:complete len:122 (+) Transcript_2098:70-435(+)
MQKPRGAWGAGSAPIVHAAQRVVPSSPSSSTTTSLHNPTLPIKSNDARNHKEMSSSPKFDVDQAAAELNREWQFTLAQLRANSVDRPFVYKATPDASNHNTNHAHQSFESMLANAFKKDAK